MLGSYDLSMPLPTLQHTYRTTERPISRCRVLANSGGEASGIWAECSFGCGSDEKLAVTFISFNGDQVRSRRSQYFLPRRQPLYPTSDIGFKLLDLGP